MDGRTDGRTEKQIHPGWAGHPDGFPQVNPGWAGHPDGFLQVNTLLRYPSLSPYRQTDGGTNTLASRGLEEHFFCQF